MNLTSRVPALVALSTWISCPPVASAGGEEKETEEPRFASDVVRAGSVDIEVDIRGAKELYLVVTDGGDGFGCDWADWAEPRLEGPKGVKKLTELRWKSARAGWGRVRVDRNAGGGALRIAGKDIAYGIGTHAPSVIRYELPAGYHRFRARAGLDNGGTDQGCGSTVSFRVYTRRPPEGVLRRAAPRRSGGGGPLPPADSVELLDVCEGLEVALFAHEPMVKNPANMDIDARGRVWITEGINYRRWRELEPEGDRIVILEDTDGDGRADTSKVFYQGTDVNSALGICVLGEKVIVSCSPNVFVFTDEDGDDVPDRKELLFTGIGGVQHDHGVHAFVFGPDGKLYFNFGNSGGRLLDAEGQPVVDLAGNVVRADGKPYHQGMVFRCELDGSGVETLGHNFRNNYEVAVDSFGTLWQSDNDDDGNRGVRINYVIKFGNYGYRDELTGAGWRAPRTGMHPAVPIRHWHQNDPGVVPNFVQTGAGSPTGICVYEGELLPEVFRGEVLHCDAGPNVVRAYPAATDGAGYRLAAGSRGDDGIDEGWVELVRGRDRWFRPSDVAVAADGSVFISDWYDAGVGGHAMADHTPGEIRGRIYRVAPRGHRREVQEMDLSTPEAAARELASPNHARRYLAWRALRSMGRRAEKALVELRESDRPRLRARALHLLARIPGVERERIDEALGDENPDIRIAALRIARERGLDTVSLVRRLLEDPSPRVRRECAIALRHDPSPRVPELWAELALRHDGRDRWYVEALGIGADRREEECFDAWLERVGEYWRSPAGRDIVWRSRSPKAARYLARLIEDPVTPAEEIPRYLRAFDFLEGTEKDRALVSLLASPRELVVAECLKRIERFDIRKDTERRAIVERLFEKSRGTERYIEIARRFGLEPDVEVLLELVAAFSTESAGAEAARLLLDRGEMEPIEEVLRGRDSQLAVQLVRALGNANDQRAVPIVLPLLEDADRDPLLAAHAARSLARTKKGAAILLERAKDERLSEELEPVVAVALGNAPWEDIRSRARSLLPPPEASNSEPLPPVQELVKMRGDASRGREVFETLCAKCHRIGDSGKELGPDLSKIGEKLGKDALFLSILDPNAGISFDYEGTELVLRSGDVLVGIPVSETDGTLTLKSEGGIFAEYAKKDILRRRRLETSLMPSNLQVTMTVEELVGLVEFLSRQR